VFTSIEACQFLSNFFPFFETASVSCLHVHVEHKRKCLRQPKGSEWLRAKREQTAKSASSPLIAFYGCYVISFSSGFLEILEA